ncbi:RNA polymerase sigma factor [Baekduia alba]|uniref:RNA polymerase sigma factor n=1 Tax=Baekduia alba TaxID=2997333 RepID=UPI0023421162|nr:RNA polymerase sigma factor [Baekduia alba]WCB92058.1 RNA polymerase sigma factor [Baekduia alba]
MDEDFGTFYERHVGVVTSYVARRVGGRPELVFDVVAETFARALENRAQYDATRGPEVAWLIGIARNLLYDAARRRRVDAAARRRLDMAPIHLDAEQLARIEERGAVDLRGALADLPADQREAVLRRVLAEQPYTAIAADIGCSEQVVRQRVSRGLARLRRTLEEENA